MHFFQKKEWNTLQINIKNNRILPLNAFYHSKSLQFDLQSNVTKMSACLSPSWIANQIGDILNGKKRSTLKSDSKTIQVVGCLNHFRKSIFRAFNCSRVKG
jgi:hypothetical protein